MKECVAGRLGRVAADQKVNTMSEAALKNGVILPLLRCLGWDVEDVDEVYPELSVQDGRIDYALRIQETNKVFLEVKKAAEDLRAHEEQLLGYAFRYGVEMAVLNNGITWWFYLPKEEGAWDARRFFTLDVFERDTEEASDRLIQFLSRGTVETGKAVQRARDLQRSRKRDKAVAEALPRAWDRLVSGPDELLLELLSETVEAMSGFRPEIGQVVSFLQEQQRRDAGARTATAVPQRRSTGEGPRWASPVTPPAPTNKITQHDLVPEILLVLKKRGGRAPKKVVDEAIYEKFKMAFEDPWYKESVSHGVPRWQHNIAWAKEIGKKQGYIKPPAQSDHGVWELTEAGHRAAADYG